MRKYCIDNYGGISIVRKGFYWKKGDQRSVYFRYDQYDWKQLSRMTHLEPFRYPEPHYVLFDYQERNPLNYEAKVQVIGYPIL